MKVQIGTKKLNVIMITKWMEKWKGIKFILKPIEEVYQFRSSYANTYFLFQRVDIVMTRKDHTILYLFPNCKTEKLIFPKRGVFYTYFFPLESCKQLNIGQKLKLKN